MTLHRLDIEGFGHFYGQQFELRPGLNVLLGPNEAGKSTLMRFVHHVLFGPPRARRREQALAGGRLGGAIVVDDGQGPLRVSRLGSHLEVSRSGSPAPTSALDACIGNLDSASFDAVFGCDLDDLQQLSALTDEALRAKLFASSVIGAGADVEAVKEAWVRRTKELGRSMRSGRLPQLRQELEHARTELKEARRRSRELPALVQRLTRANAALSSSQRQRSTAQLELLRLQAVDAALPHLASRHEASQWLESHRRPKWPAAQWERAVSRVDAVVSAVDESTRRCEEQRALHHQAVQEITAIQVDERLSTQHTPLLALERRFAGLPTRGQTEKRANDLKRARDEALLDLGLPSLQDVLLDDQTSRGLRELARAIPPAPQVQQAREQLQAATSGLEESRREREALPPDTPARALQPQMALLAATHSALPSLVAAMQDLDGQLAAVRKQLVEGSPDGGGIEVDPSDLAELRPLLAAWTEREDQRRVAARTASIRAHELRQQVAQYSNPLVVPKVSARARRWVEGRPAIPTAIQELQQLSERAALLGRHLDEALLAVPSARPLLDTHGSVPWAPLQAAAEAVLQARAHIEPTTQSAGPELAVCIQRRDTGLELLRSEQNAQLWRFFALAAVVLGVACLLVLLAALVFQQQVLAGVSVVALGLTALLAAFAFFTGSRSQSAVRTGLVDLDVDGRPSLDTLLLELQSAVASAQTRGAFLPPDVARQAAVQERLAMLLAEHGLVGKEASEVVELCRRIPACFEVHERMRQTREDAASRQRLVDQWVDEGVAVAAELGVTKPRNALAALELADRVQDRLQERTQLLARQQERARSHEEAREALGRAEAQQRTLNQPSSCHEALRVRLASLEAPAETPEQAQAWLDAAQATVETRAVLTSLTSELEGVREQRLEAEKSIQEAVDQAGVTHFEELAGAVELALEVDGRRQKLQRDIEEGQRDVDRAQRALGQLQDAQDERASHLQELSDELARCGWPIVAPEDVPDLHQRLRACRTLVRDERQATRAAEEDLVVWTQWLDNVSSLATSLGRSPPADDEAHRWVRSQAEAANHAAAAKVMHTERLRRVESTSEALHEAEAIARAGRTSLDGVLEELGIQGAEEARAELLQAQAWEGRYRAFEAAESACRAALGRFSDTMEGVLSSEETSDLAERTLQATAACERAESAVEDAMTERTQLEGIIAALQDSADVPRAQATVATKEARMASTERELAELELAVALLRHTYDAYVRENQPAVLRTASDLLRRSSAGDMTGVREHAGSLYVESAGGSLRTPDALSRGAREMLYLVIRFALAIEHAKSTHLPLILDDVLVNQDPVRAQGLARVLCEVAVDQQVLLLTCRPETRDLFVALEPSTHVLELERYAGRGSPLKVDPAQPVQVRTHVGVDAVESVSRWLSKHAGWQQKGPIMAALGLSAGEWNRVLQAVQDGDPRIEHNGGRKRGAAYRAPAVS